MSTRIGEKLRGPESSFYDKYVIEPDLEQVPLSERDLQPWEIIGVVRGPLRTDNSLAVQQGQTLTQLPRPAQTVFVVFRDSERRLHLRPADTLPEHIHWRDYPDFEMTPAEFAKLIEEDDTMEGHEHRITNDRKAGPASQITWRGHPRQRE